MRICILTLPLYTNYGGLLQAYALQTVLKKLGHDVWVENRKNNKVTYWILFKRLVVSLLSHISSRYVKTYYPNEKQQAVIGKYTNQFIDRYINTTIPIYSDNKESLLQYGFDAYVVGSDQVWRLKYSRGITNYYLDFVENRKVKKVAYAASFGVDKWEYNRRLTQICARLAKKFDAISVRESSAKYLCNRYLGVRASHVLDPTLLLNKNDYINIINADCIPEYKDKLFIYILDESSEKTKIIDFVSRKLDLKYFSVMPPVKFENSGDKYLDKCVFPPVSNWLRAFMDAEYVITDSFHGTVFSIIFNKPFLAIGNPSRGLSRFKSLLSTFDLEDRLIESSEDLSEDLILNPIDYSLVNKIKIEEVNKSMNFIIESLK